MQMVWVCLLDKGGTESSQLLIDVCIVSAFVSLNICTKGHASFPPFFVCDDIQHPPCDMYDLKIVLLWMGFIHLKYFKGMKPIR